MKESEQNFDELKRLLKLKRHEIPPPGYFHNFSSDVLAGIRAERNGAQSRLSSEASWLTRFLRIFETRPGLVGGMATSVVLLLVFGVVLADHSDSDTQNIFTGSASVQAPSQQVASASNFGGDNSVVGGISISTNPITSLQPASSLFGQVNPLFQSASFAPAH
jgi:hypothetical protein